MDLCKTRAKKSSPDMFKFFVDLAGHDMVTDAKRAITCRHKFKAPSLQTQITKKNERPPENIGFKVKSLKISEEERAKTIFSTSQKKPNGKQKTLQVSIDHGPRKQ